MGQGFSGRASSAGGCESSPRSASAPSPTFPTPPTCAPPPPPPPTAHPICCSLRVRRPASGSPPLISGNVPASRVFTFNSSLARPSLFSGPVRSARLAARKHYLLLRASLPASQPASQPVSGGGGGAPTALAVLCLWQAAERASERKLCKPSARSLHSAKLGSQLSRSGRAKVCVCLCVPLAHIVCKL